MKRSTLLFVSGVMIVMFQNCAQNVNFKSQDGSSLNGESGSLIDPANSNNGDDNATTPSAPSASGKESQEQFKVTFNSESAPLDMMWVIDNSGSMSQEAALVRKNFDAFLTTLNKSTNFRLLLISKQSNSGYGVAIPSSFDSATHKQIDFEVASTNGPEILLAKLKTLPAGFLREDSKKIVVFVTDDNSKMASKTFMSSLLTQQAWSAKDVSVSSFIALDAKTSPCYAAVGTVYKELATQTSGNTYNICSEDWSAHFNDLMNSSVSKAVRRFTLAENAVKSIVEVKVDGMVLSSSAYSLSGKVLTLADGVNLTENSMVSIVYTH